MVLASNSTATAPMLPGSIPLSSGQLPASIMAFFSTQASAGEMENAGASAGPAMSWAFKAVLWTSP